MKDISMKQTRQFAMNLAKRAGAIAKKRFGHKLKIVEKSLGQFVTDADKKVEKFIISSIKKKFPDHHILAEESGENGKHSEYTWIIDPIDGTNNFMSGIPDFGIEIALAKNNEVLLGVIYLPMYDELYVAEKGKGAFMNGKRIHVSGKKEEDETMLLYSCTFRQNLGWHIGHLDSLMRVFKRPRLLGSASIELAYVAIGRAESYVAWHDEPWDYAAGNLIVEEAGGKVTTLDGKPWFLGMGGLVASNRRFHDRILQALR